MTGTPDRRVTIVPARAEWPEEFRRVARSLRETLGPIAMRIDHIGSTSVPGLAAKDVIDVQLTVGDLAALGIDRGAYAEVKDPACDLIMVAAEAWAERTGWKP